MTDFSNKTRGKEKDVLLPYLGGHLPGFLLIGVLTTCIDIWFLWFLTEKIGLWYLASATISYCIGSVISFFLNKSLNYRNKSRNFVRQGMSFLVIAASSFTLNLAILSIGVEIFQIQYLIAKAGATMFAFLWNYFAQTTITFKIWK